MANTGLWPVCCAEKSHTILADAKRNSRIGDGLPELNSFRDSQLDSKASSATCSREVFYMFQRTA